MSCCRDVPPIPKLQAVAEALVKVNKSRILTAALQVLSWIKFVIRGFSLAFLRNSGVLKIPNQPLCLFLLTRHRRG